MRYARSLIAGVLFSIGITAAATDPPKIDKTKLEAYIRYAEAFTNDVQFSIDDPIPSAYAGYFRVVAHLTKGRNRLDRVYYVSADGKHFVNGAIWDLNESPFLDTLIAKRMCDRRLRPKRGVQAFLQKETLLVRLRTVI